MAQVDAGAIATDPKLLGEYGDDMADEQQPSVPPETGYDANGVPTFDAVREKIETRFGTAIGATELAEETPEGRSVADQYEKRQEAAAEKLRQIRESMGKGES